MNSGTILTGSRAHRFKTLQVQFPGPAPGDPDLDPIQFTVPLRRAGDPVGAGLGRQVKPVQAGKGSVVSRCVTDEGVSAGTQVPVLTGE